jgi:tetratricopeptide (TPR) repeat protein
MMRFKEANLAYQSADYSRAIPLYEQTVQNDPNLTAVYFFLGNSYDNLYQPGVDEPANKENLNKAIQNYEIAAEKIPTDTPENAKLKMLSLQYLAAAYGPDKLDDPAKAEPVIQRMINLDPADVSSYFSLSKLYEDAGAFAEAEQMLLYAKDVKPNDSGVYMQLARYYNTQGEFAKTIEALEQRAKLEPDNPEAFFTISTYYWDNAQRNLRLADAEKMANVKNGLAAVDRALQIRPDYMEALVYKGLLLRTQANIEKDPNTQQALLKEAVRLQTEADELRKKKAAGLAGN